MEDSDPRTVELFVRTLAPSSARESQDDVVERLVELERREAVDDVDLTVWGDAVCMDGACARLGTGSHVTDRLRAFRRWCEECGASLDPFFTWSAVDSSITGECYERVVPPHRCLAVYRNDAVVDVYPSRIGDQTRSLEDGLRALERRANDANASTAVPEEVR